MNIKPFVLAAALVITATSAVNAATNEINNGKFENDFKKWTEVGSNIGTLNGSDAAAIGSSGLGSIIQAFSIATDGIYKLAFDFASIKKLSVAITDLSSNTILWSTNLAAGINGSFSKKLDLDAGTYSLSFTSKNALVDNVSLKATAVAVPGPEAGAGLGALAMGGVAFWMSRRRQSGAAAA
ncbi:hypothetical protein EV130_12040 [Rhizobium azibense]|uniref:Secreted protein n=1 Tax=Rhizobium azibense TaxID=1136135 RepID=A0A4R3QC53_9HYPH|nr:hypothetical protein [Rhizobium azibense]TCU15656.1 hypothetical protein EV130_12040 [Rhizobium azibense]TCU31414.1 hypothetical protein EV129_12840 [Rhizobium azibense]